MRHVKGDVLNMVFNWNLLVIVMVTNCEDKINDKVE